MQNRYQNLVENAVDIIFETDSEGKFTFANDFTIQHLGYSLDEILEMPFTHFIRVDYKESLSEFYKDLSVLNGDFPSIEFPIIKKDGTEIWGSQKVIAHRDEDGNLIGYVGIIRDITLLKNLESKEKKRLEKIEKYNATINCLTSSNFSKLDNFNEVLQIIVKKAALDTHSDLVSYWNYKTQELNSIIAYNSLTDNNEHRQLDPNQFREINFNYLKGQKTIEFPDLKKQSNPFFGSFSGIDPDYNSMLLMSVMHNDDLMGILCFSNKEVNRKWDNEDSGFIRSIIDIISLQLELQLRIETEAKLKYRSHVWSVVSHCTEKYLQSKSPIELFAETFSEIGKATNVDHIYYYEKNFQTQLVRQKYKWGKENIPLQITPIRDFSHDDLKEIVDAAAAKKPFISAIRSMEEGMLKEVLSNNGLKSVIIWPLFLYNKFSGFIGFDSCSEERVWTEDEIVIFQVLTNNISSLIERSTNENHARESEERFRLLADNIPGTVYLSKYDALWSKIYINDQITNLTGYSKSDFILKNMSFSELIHEDDRAEIIALSTSIIEKGERLHLTYRIRTKDNSIKWIEEFADTIKTGDVIEFIEGIYIDITAKKETESAVLDKELAEAANKAKSQFLANMSHEIKTPLNGIIGFTDLLMQTKLTQEQECHMSTVHHSAVTLLGIINDILDFSKIEAGKLELDLQPTVVSELLESISEVIRFDLEQKQLKLEISVDSEIPEVVLLDPIRVKQILLNLLSNAIKFTVTGTIKLKLKFKRRINTQTLQMRFSVIDTGIGILPINQKKIFEPFLQEDNSTSRKYGGTGLGLTITSQLLQLMESKLKVSSEPNEGSKFYFDLFVKENDEFEFVNDWSDNSVQAYDTSRLKMKILIAEDNLINMLLIKTILKSLFPKAVLIESQNGEEAVQSCLATEPDLILMDIQMPVLNGLEATKQIRALYHNDNLPIIALTAGTLKEERELCMASGMNDFVSKPIVKDTIKDVILKWRTTYKN